MPARGRYARTIACSPATTRRKCASRCRGAPRSTSTTTASRVAEDHSDDLDLDTVVDIFVADLHARGQSVARPDEPLRDIDFIARLARTYRVLPTQYPTVEETDAVARVEAAIGT